MIKSSNFPAPSNRRRILQASILTALGMPVWLRAQSQNLRIGQTAALTGPLAFPFVEMNKGIAAAFQEVNDKGGIDGRMLEMVSLDDVGMPAKAAENTRQLIEKDQVLTMFACGGTTSVMGALQVLVPAKVPLIAPATGSDALRPFNPLVFHTRASYAQELNKIARQLSSTGFTKCAVAYFDNPFGKAAIAAFEAAAKSYKNTDWKAFLVAETPEGIAKGIEEIVAFQPTALMSLAIGGLGIPFYKGLRKRIQTPAFSISFLGSRCSPLWATPQWASRWRRLCPVRTVWQCHSFMLIRARSRRQEALSLATLRWKATSMPASSLKPCAAVAAALPARSSSTPCTRCAPMTWAALKFAMDPTTTVEPILSS